MTEAPEDDLRWYRADRVAELLDVKVSWLKEKARLREIPVTPLPCGYRWSAKQIKEIHEMFAVDPASNAGTLPAGPPQRPKRPASSGGVTVLKSKRPRRVAS